MIKYQRINMIDKQNDNLIIGINLGDFGSTGNIMLNSLEYAHEHGSFDVIACIPYETKQVNKVKTLSFGAKIPKWKRGYYRILRKLKFPIINDGNYYKEYSKKLINIIKDYSKYYKTTIIHMHNMHHSNLDINYFYIWLGKQNYKVLYTLHDCWTFTGGCYTYSFIKCNKWQNKCLDCPLKIKYSKYQLYKRTKLIRMIPNIQIISVSNWADQQLKLSKIHNITSKVIWGETSLKPFYGKTNLKNELMIDNKKIILFVGAYWNDWKGERYIYDIANLISNDYVIIVIGKFNIRGYKNIIQKDVVSHDKLSEFYSISDVYVSVTQSEQLGLTTCEAQICGTPVVMFGHCGSKETVIDGKSGVIVGEDNNIEKLVKAIKYVVENKPFKKEDIIASGNRFKKYEHAKKMFSIYNNLVK